MKADKEAAEAAAAKEKAELDGLKKKALEMDLIIAAKEKSDAEAAEKQRVADQKDQKEMNDKIEALLI